jgi:hypothetical protein
LSVRLYSGDDIMARPEEKRRMRGEFVSAMKLPC